MIDAKQLKAMAELRRALQIFAATLHDNEETAIEIAGLYPVWEANKQYKANDIVQYGTNSVGDPQLYLVLQAHKSQSDWLPDATASLYKKMGISESGYPIWTQPLCAVDAYNLGDIVSYNGKLYKSIINANVWALDVYPAGWEEYTESTSGGDSGETGGGGTTEPTEPETPPTETIPDFVQPTGAHDAYKKGDKVKFEGKIYESLIDANAYSPSAYPAGWKEITE
uniref:ChiA1-BD-binding domain protein n=1 Tax=Siphoviridae sp. ctKcB20 TaxID=2827568 RepID=A0A8S5LKR0_9CAUD|nr:MAG TPA: ChiA1-BD-binding domain protein [Siphoviridae sp. ctKcB20]